VAFYGRNEAAEFRFHVMSAEGLVGHIHSRGERKKG